MRYALIGMVVAVAMVACQFDTSGVASGPDASGSSPTDAAVPPQEIRLASANLRCLLDDWDARVQALAAELAAYRPSMVALQEVCRDDSRDGLAELQGMLEALTGTTYVAVRTDTHLAWDRYQEGIAVLVDQAIADATIVELPAGLFQRRAVVVRVPGLLLASTHLSFGDQQNARRAQMDTLLQAMSDIRGADETMVIAGDFNETPDGLVLTSALVAGFQDAWSTLHPADPGPTFPSAAPDVRIDFVLVAPGAAGLRPVSAERFLDTPTAGIMPSDHLGLQVVLAR